MMQRDNLTIKLMNRENIDEVFEIESKSFSNPWTKSMLESELDNNNSNVYVSILDNKIVGYICYQTILDEGYLLNIVVSTEYRRQGIANLLMEKMLSDVENKKLSFVTLEVRITNDSAINLYKKFKFEKIAIRKNYYSNPLEDAVLMTRYFEV